MTALTDLSTHIKADDDRAFLESYLSLLAEGYTLSIPTETNLQDVTEGWEQILIRYNRNFSDPFLEQLSKSWLRLLQKQGGKIGNNFAEELLDIFTDGKRASSQKSDQKESKTPTSKTTPSKLDAVALTQNPLEDDVKSHISDHYYKVEDAKKSDFPDLKTLAKQEKQAIKDQDVEAYLIAYLSRLMNKEKPEVPMSSVLPIIKSHWEEILLFNDQHPSKDFIELLCTKWFYLVNQNGLPSTDDTLQSLLFTLIADYQGQDNKSPLPQKKKGLFNRLFGS